MTQYNQKEVANFYAPSEFTLPKFFKLVSTSMRRYRLWFAQQNAKKETPVLTEADPIALHRTTSFHTFSSARAFRFIIATNRSGMHAKKKHSKSSTTKQHLAELQAAKCENAVSQHKSQRGPVEEVPSVQKTNHTFFDGQVVLSGKPTA